MALKLKTGLLFCCIGSLLITAIILLSLSVSITNIDEIALTRHTRSQEVYYDENFASPGRHFTGLFKQLIIFKRNRIFVNFADDSNTPNETSESNVVASGGNRLSCWTKDGTNVYIDISYYFTLVPEKLLDFYTEYGDKWLDFVVRLSYTIIKETTINYTTEEFFTERNTISEKISEGLTEGFKNNFASAIKLEDLQLRKIVFDDKFEEATVNKLIQAQKRRSYQNKKTIREAQKDTEMKVSAIQNQIDQKLAEGRAEAIVDTETRTSEAFLELIKQFNLAYNTLKSSLSLTDNNELKKYIYAMELELINNYQEVVFVDANQSKIINTSN